MEEYIVYEVTYKNKPVYIGSGKRERVEHAKSGKSHCVELNKLFFEDNANIDVLILRENLTKQESLELEKEYIQATEPKFNKIHTNRYRKIKRQLINL